MLTPHKGSAVHPEGISNSPSTPDATSPEPSTPLSGETETPAAPVPPPPPPLQSTISGPNQPEFTALAPEVPAQQPVQSP